MQVEKLFKYNPSESDYELAKHNKMFLVVHGDGYTNDEIPENEILDIETPLDEYFVLKHYSMQRLALCKDLLILKKWNLLKNGI
jgi:hypothetical protein